MRKRENVRAKIATAATDKPPGSSQRFDHTQPWVRRLLRCVVLVLMIGIVYSNSFQSGWVLDNKLIIQLDPRNKEASLENLKLIWEKDYWWPRADTGAYRPIVSTTYWLNWSVFGNGKHARETDQVVGFHWVNLIAHGINAALVYFLMLKLTRRNGAAFLTAALFAVHPIATESVTNIIGRADEFLTMSFLGCTLLYIRSTEASGLRRIPWLLALMVLFAAGCLSKESAPAFLAVPILFDGIYRWGSEQYRGRRARGILFDWLSYMLISLSILAVLFVRSVVFRQSSVPPVLFVDNPILRFSWNEASSLSVNAHNWILGRMTAFNVAAKALWKLIWPVHLSSDYSYNQIALFRWPLSNMEDIKAILSTLFIAGTLALAVWCYRRNKAVSFFIALYWITYGPTSNFLVNGTSIMAERFLYLPLVAFCALLVLAADILIRRIGATLEFASDSLKRPWPRLVPHAVFALLLVLYGIRSYNRNFDWRSDVTIAESAIKVSPDSFRSYFTLARTYYEIDPTSKVDRMIELGETGLRIVDPLPDGENVNLVYVQQGVYYGLKAKSALTRRADGSLAMNDVAREWYRKSAQVLERGSEVDRAANDAQRVRELRRGRTNIPDTGSKDLYMNLGATYAQLGMKDKALEAFTYGRHLDPQEPAAYMQIASAQFALGQTENAIVSLIQCVILAPQHTDAWQSLMELYSQINREPIPAVEVTDGRPQLRQDNKLVQQHLLRAYEGFLSLARSSARPEMQREAQDAAVNFSNFNPSLLDAALQGKIARPVPPAPVFHTYGKKLSEESAMQPPR